MGAEHPPGPSEMQPGSSATLIAQSLERKGLAPAQINSFIPTGPFPPCLTPTPLPAGGSCNPVSSGEASGAYAPNPDKDWFDFDLQGDLAKKAGPIVSPNTWEPFSASAAQVEEMCLYLCQAFLS